MYTITIQVAQNGIETVLINKNGDVFVIPFSVRNYDLIDFINKSTT